MLHGCYTVSLLVQLCLSGAYSKTQVTPWKRFHQSLTKKNIAPLLDHLTNVCRTSVNIGWNHKERNLSIFFYFLYCHCILVVALSLMAYRDTAKKGASSPYEFSNLEPENEYHVVLSDDNGTWSNRTIKTSESTCIYCI